VTRAPAGAKALAGVFVLLATFPPARGASAADPAAGPALRVVVLDPSGDLIVGARVTLSRDGRERRTLATAASGDARFGRLRAGAYSLHVEANGFDPADLAGVTADSPDSRVEVRLEIARVHEDVQVSANESGAPDQRDAFSTVLTDEIASSPTIPTRWRR
jgi:hypothetical protein